MKPSTILLGAFIVVFAGCVYFSPLLTIRSLQEAAAAGDMAQITDHVDMDSLRESLKHTMSDSMQESMKKYNITPGGFLANLLFGLNKVLSGAEIDSMVKPENIGKMLRWGYPYLPVTEKLQVIDVPEPPSTSAASMTMSYRSFFIVAVHSKDKKDYGSFVLTRTGLWGWKISGIDLTH